MFFIASSNSVQTNCITFRIPPDYRYNHLWTLTIIVIWRNADMYLEKMSYLGDASDSVLIRLRLKTDHDKVRCPLTFFLMLVAV